MRLCPIRLLTLPILAAAALSAGAYHEAPMLAELVEAGKLPPVEERLPEEPAVVEPVHSTGKYGGTWRMLAMRPTDTLMGTGLGYEPLVRWDRSGTKPVPGLAESWEILDGGKTYVFHLRKGLKWSDSHPFSSEDFLFWYEDVMLNKELTPVFPTWLVPSGNRFKVTAPDRYSVAFHFKRPNGIFLEVLCFRGHYIYHPRHYLKQFHRRYADKETLEKQARKIGVNLWHQLFLQKSDLHENPDLPTIRPWQLVIGPPATRYLVERNPYYWKVDPQGNQLPYIDRIAFSVVQNKEVLNFKAMTGGVDMQGRYIDVSKYTLFMKNRKKNKYRVLADLFSSARCVYLNQHSKDPRMRPLLQDRRFRIALSVAIDREELIEFIYAGLAEPSNAVSFPLDPYYLPRFKKKHTRHAPDLSDKLLDQVGLKKGPDGMRRMPDGEPFRQILHCYPSEGGGNKIWQLVTDYWRQVGLDFVVKSDAPTLSVLRVRNGNSDFWAYANVGLHWSIDPGWYVPIRESAYFAPLYGRHYTRNGKSGVKPSPEFQRLVDWYRELAGTYGDEDRKLALGRRILSQWADECYVIGIVWKKSLTIVKHRFKNMPGQYIRSYRLMSPGYLNPEQFYLEEE